MYDAAVIHNYSWLSFIFEKRLLLHTCITEDTLFILQSGRGKCHCLKHITETFCNHEKLYFKDLSVMLHLEATK